MKKKKVIFIACTIILITAAIVFGVLSNQSQQNEPSKPETDTATESKKAQLQKQAEKYMKNNEFDKAIEIYVELGAQKELLEAKYQRATQLLSKDDVASVTEAAFLLESIPEYNDSAALLETLIWVPCYKPADTCVLNEKGLVIESTDTQYPATFTYDTNNRLVKLEYTAQYLGSLAELTYDSNGNITKYEIVAGHDGPWFYSYVYNNGIVVERLYQHDSGDTGKTKYIRDENGKVIQTIESWSIGGTQTINRNSTHTSGDFIAIKKTPYNVVAYRQFEELDINL